MVRSESPQRILLIEDSPADVMLLRMAMEDAGIPIDLTVCGDGEAAIAHFRSGEAPPDVVLLDLNVPCRDGLEILQSLREAESWRTTPVVVFTSAVTPKDRARIQNFGATFLPKPHSYGGFVAAAAQISRAGQRCRVA